MANLLICAHPLTLLFSLSHTPLPLSLFSFLFLSYPFINIFINIFSHLPINFGHSGGVFLIVLLCVVLPSYSVHMCTFGIPINFRHVHHQRITYMYNYIIHVGYSLVMNWCASKEIIHSFYLYPQICILNCTYILAIHKLHVLCIDLVSIMCFFFVLPMHIHVPLFLIRSGPQASSKSCLHASVHMYMDIHTPKRLGEGGGRL